MCPLRKRTTTSSGAKKTKKTPEAVSQAAAAAPKSATGKKTNRDSPDCEPTGQPGEERDNIPTPPQQTRYRRLASIALAGIATASVRRLYVAYETFGWAYFVPSRFKTLDLSSDEWQSEVLASKAVVFVGGHHRSGTTVIWDRLRRHPGVASFGEQKSTGVDFSEGIFAQDVYPTFGVGAAPGVDVAETSNNRSSSSTRIGGKQWADFVASTRTNESLWTVFVDVVKEAVLLRAPSERKNKEEQQQQHGEDAELSESKETPPKKSVPTGLGRYALGPESEVHWTETRSSVSAENQRKVLNKFGYYWTEQRVRDPHVRVLLEKSPPNAVLSRFLQALVNVGRCDDSSASSEASSRRCWRAEPPHFGGVAGAAKFIFVQRHPLAVALAHREWRECRGLDLDVLVANWVAVAVYMRLDAAKLEAVMEVKLEDFTKAPKDVLLSVWHWLGLDDLLQKPVGTRSSRRKHHVEFLEEEEEEEDSAHLQRDAPPGDSNDDAREEDSFVLHPLLEDAAAGILPDPNAKYLAKYCRLHYTPDAHAALVARWGGAVTSLGYDLDEWGVLCQQQLSPDP